jgi:hypothetical protein
VSNQVQNASIGVSGTGVPEVLVTAPVPAATAPPLVSGDAIVGETLTDFPASWSNAPTNITYQWLRCDATASLAGCHSVAGATGNTYTIAEADALATIRVQETASNRYGVGSAAVSAPTAPVSAPTPPVRFPRPIGITLAATRLSRTHATLNARVKPNGETVTVNFQFAQRANMARAKTTRSVRVQAGDSFVPISIGVSQLATRTRYYFRVTVTDEHHSTARGRVLSFTTAGRK